MPQILIRKLDDAVVRGLREKAASEGVSMEEEARRILQKAILEDVPKMSLREFLCTMPDVGDDTVFERPRRQQRKVRI